MNKIAMKLATMNAVVAGEEGYDKYAALKMPNNKFTKVVRRVPRSVNNYLGKLTGRTIKKMDKSINRMIDSYIADQHRKMDKKLNNIARRMRASRFNGNKARFNKLKQQYIHLTPPEGLTRRMVMDNERRNMRKVKMHPFNQKKRKEAYNNIFSVRDLHYRAQRNDDRGLQSPYYLWNWHPESRIYSKL